MKDRKYPSLYTLNELMAMGDPHSSEPKTAVQINGEWVPARFLGYPSIFRRIKLGWMVFTGKADAFTWPSGQ